MGWCQGLLILSFLGYLSFTVWVDFLGLCLGAGAGFLFVGIRRVFGICNSGPEWFRCEDTSSIPYYGN